MSCRLRYADPPRAWIAWPSTALALRAFSWSTGTDVEGGAISVWPSAKAVRSKIERRIFMAGPTMLDAENMQKMSVRASRSKQDLYRPSTSGTLTPTLPHEHSPAVHVKHFTGDESGKRRAQKKNGPGNLLRRRHPAEGDGGEDAFAGGGVVQR